MTAIVLHYAYMSTFAWTFVESLHVYRVLTEVRNIDAGPMRFYYVMGWGIPAIVTGETRGAATGAPGPESVTPGGSHVTLLTQEPVSDKPAPQDTGSRAVCLLFLLSPAEEALALCTRLRTRVRSSNTHCGDAPPMGVSSLKAGPGSVQGSVCGT